MMYPESQHIVMGTDNTGSSKVGVVGPHESHKACLDFIKSYVMVRIKQWVIDSTLTSVGCVKQPNRRDNPMLKSNGTPDDHISGARTIRMRYVKNQSN